MFGLKKQSTAQKLTLPEKETPGGPPYGKLDDGTIDEEVIWQASRAPLVDTWHAKLWRECVVIPLYNMGILRFPGVPKYRLTKEELVIKTRKFDTLWILCIRIPGKLTGHVVESSRHEMQKTKQRLYSMLVGGRVVGQLQPERLLPHHRHLLLLSFLVLYHRPSYQMLPS